MDNEEFTKEELLVLIKLVRTAKDEVHEALDVVKILGHPTQVLSREYEALQALRNKILGILR